MKVSHGIQDMVLIIHQSIHLIAGAIVIWQIKGDLQLRGFVGQVHQCLLGLIWQVMVCVLCPLHQSAQALGKLLTIVTALEMPQFIAICKLVKYRGCRVGVPPPHPVLHPSEYRYIDEDLEDLAGGATPCINLESE